MCCCPAEIKGEREAAETERVLNERETLSVPRDGVPPPTVSRKKTWEDGRKPHLKGWAVGPKSR